jgi:hypothetical protein
MPGWILGGRTLSLGRNTRPSDRSSRSGSARRTIRLPLFGCETRRCGCQLLLDGVLTRLLRMSPFSRLWFDVRGDAQVLPLSVGFHLREIILFHKTHCVTAEQQTEWRIVQACDVENGGSSFGGIAWLPAVIVALEPRCFAYGRIVLGTSFADCRHQGPSYTWAMIKGPISAAVTGTGNSCVFRACPGKGLSSLKNDGRR